MLQRCFVGWVLVGSIWGCGGDSSNSDAALPAVESICDGGDEARLVYAALQGFASYGSAFAGRYGDRYLVIDGTCRYWVGSGSLRGLRSGVLDADASRALSEQLHFGRYAAVEAEAEAVCPDAGLSLLADSTGTMSTSYCGIEQQPRVLREAFLRVPGVAEQLDEGGEVSWSPSTVLALRDPPLPPEVPGDRVVQEWTSDLDLEAGSVSFTELQRGLDAGAGVRVEDDATLALLAELREAELARDPNAVDLLVRDGSGRYFQLLVRDEPPALVAEALLSRVAPVR